MLQTGARKGRHIYAPTKVRICNISLIYLDDSDHSLRVFCEEWNECTER